MSLSKEEAEEKIDEEAIKIEQIRRKQKKARLLKLRLAAVNVPDSFGKPERREIIQKSKGTKEFNQAAGENALDKQTQDRVRQEVNFINKGTKIKPPKKPIDVKLRRKLAQEQKLAKEHGHSIVFRGHPRGQFKIASLESQDKNYAKYFLLNAKQINGNGWGIAQHTARENMKKFIGRPLVVTSSHWHGASLYGESYEHPYLPTNDLNQIFAHQEQFRVGNIIGIDESKNGDFHAVVEMLPQFASKRLPPFCSPAIFQLDAMEHEGQISKWEALHLAALDSDPAYGARVAILKGTCVGTEHACTVQFKSAKQRNANIFDEAEMNQDQDSVIGLKRRRDEGVIRRNGRDIIATKSNKSSLPKKDVDNMKKRLIELGIDKPTKQASIICPVNYTRLKGRVAGISTNDRPKQKPPVITALGPRKPFKNSEQKTLDNITKPFNQRGFKEPDDSKKKNLEAKLQRIAGKSVEDILRGKGRSVDASHAQSSFLSSKGDFIGDPNANSHASQIRRILNDPKLDSVDPDIVTTEFSSKHGLPRVQNFPINREGVKKVSVGIHSPISQTQLKSIMELEKGGRSVGFAVGPNATTAVTGEGTKDLVKALRENKLLR
jgi:hypothetical protein